MRAWRSLGSLPFLIGACAPPAPPPDPTTAPREAATTTAPLPPPPAEAPAIGPVDTSALEAYFTARFPADQPGIAVLVAKRGQTVFERGYGVADVVTRTPITPRTLFNVGSLTKTVVASAILLLAERGRLSVDDPLSRYFPEFKRPEIAAKVKLRHLLTHTSGLPDVRPVEAQEKLYLTADDAQNWQPITQVAALGFEPGARYEYSNPAFDGLALVIEKITGKDWRLFVHDEIFVPAGMKTSTITFGPHPESGVAHGYKRQGDRLVERDFGEEPTFCAAGNGGVWSSVEELALYEKALASGRILKPETIADARTVKTFPRWSSPKPPEVGWAWRIREVEGLREIGHTGHQGGFMTNYFVVPDKEVLVVFLMNGPGDFDAITGEVHRWLRERKWLDDEVASRR